MSSDSELRHVHEINCYWNELLHAAREAPVRGELEPTTVELIAWLHELGSASAPRSSRERVRRRVRRQIASQQAATEGTSMPSFTALASTSTTAGPNGRMPLSVEARSDGKRGRPRGEWARAQLATAALVVLTLIGSVFAFGPGRTGRQADRPAFLPVMSGTPAITLPAPASLAEFVWQSRGRPYLPIGRPSQPAIDPHGTIWVPDSERDQFLLFAPDGTFLEAWGKPGSDAGQFRLGDPYQVAIGSGAVAFDAAGNIYVADTGNHRIQKFGPDRQFITSWGSEGSGAGQFRRPFALVVDGNGRVYVTDEGWGKIEVFDDQGGWLATWTGLGAPGGIAVAADGVIWVAEGGSGIVQFSPEGERLATWDAYHTGTPTGPDPVSVAVDAEGRIFVADLNADRVLVFSADGSELGAIGEHGAEPGQFDIVRGIALDGKGGVYVVDLGGKRVQKFQLLPPAILTEMSAP